MVDKHPPLDVYHVAMRRFLPALFTAVTLISQPSTVAKPAAQSSAEQSNSSRAADHQFDNGSGIALTKLSSVQVDNLVTLGRVWGFLKYHHPKVTSGALQWDYELLRVMPAILAAPDHATANGALERWIESLGPVPPCQPCAKLDDSDLSLRPDVNWISNTTLLGGDLSQLLRRIYDNRVPDKQFYVSIVPDIGNPKFEHEAGYEFLAPPDPGFQLLALFRFWNMVEYWSPYRDLVKKDWVGVLSDFVPRVALAKTSDDYKREMMALIAMAQDSHANLWGSLQARPPVGKCRVPVNVRFVENQPIVAGFSSSTSSGAADLKLGDIITAIDGVPVDKLIADWMPYYAASNETARRRDMAFFMTRGDCGPSAISIRRDGQDLKVAALRVTVDGPENSLTPHDLSGAAFRLLSKEVAYLKLSAVKSAEAVHYVHQAQGTKGWIIDIRNYPSEFMVFTLGAHLIDKETPFARFTQSDLSNPGAFHWGSQVSLPPDNPHYFGKLVILADESSMSQAEYTTMAFRSAQGAIVVGSTTSGADGNVSPILLPGGLHAAMSGIGVFYPDKSPTQQIGIIPNVEAKPTIAGIRAGRDEVLEEAIRQILGKDASPEDVEKMAKP